MGNISKIRIQNTDYAIKDSRLPDGTSSQFIKGDGSLDSNTYAGAQTSGGAANKAVSIPFGQVDSTSTSTAFTATVDGITELRDGVCVYLRNGKVTSAANCTLNVNGLGAKPMYNTMAAASAITTLWNVNYTMLFVYNSTRVSGGCWDIYVGYNSDNNTIGYQLRTNNYTLPASDTSGYYKIFFTSADNTKFVPASADSTSNATSARPVNQRPINPFGAIVYLHGTSNYEEGTNVEATAIWQQYPLTLGYSFNRTGAALTLTTSKPVYIKCAPQNDGSAIIDADVPYVQDLPTTEDGKIYIFLGIAYSATQVEMQMVHPVYYYKNGSINLWTGTGTQTDVSKAESSSVIDVGGYDLMKINEVKGKSLVWNQLVQNGAVQTVSGVTQSYDSTTGTMILNGTATANANFYGLSRYGAVQNSIPLGHKCFAITSFISGTFTGTGDSRISPSNAREPLYFKNGYGIQKRIYTASSNTYPLTTIISGDKFENVVFRQQQIDLTQMFGAGNEPTTVEEVEAILGDDYYEYNTGEVVGNNVEKLDVYDSNDTKKGSLALNLTELTGKVNGEGTSVTIYPDGLHGVGTAYDSLIVDDDGYARKAVKRMGSVDLGDVRWVIDGDNFRSQYKFPSVVGSVGFIASNTSNILCIKYTSSQIDVHNGQYVYVTDSNYSTAADFKTAMSGVMLYYELATPIEYVLDTPVQCVVPVSKNGTVKQVPVMPDSTPMVMDVTYLHDNGLYATKEYVIDAIADKADIATTLAGYGITDAKIEDKSIILGENSITPIEYIKSATEQFPVILPDSEQGLMYYDTTLNKWTYFEKRGSEKIFHSIFGNSTSSPTVEMGTFVSKDTDTSYDISASKNFFENPCEEGKTYSFTKPVQSCVFYFTNYCKGTTQDIPATEKQIQIAGVTGGTATYTFIAPDPEEYPYIEMAKTGDGTANFRIYEKPITWSAFATEEYVDDKLGDIETLLASI